MGELDKFGANKNEQIKRLYAEIDQINNEMKTRSEAGLNDPSISQDSKKLIILLDMNTQDLAKIERLQKEIVILRMEQHFEANN